MRRAAVAWRGAAGAVTTAAALFVTTHYQNFDSWISTLKNSMFIKFGHSEKGTKFEKIFVPKFCALLRTSKLYLQISRSMWYVLCIK